MRSALIIISLSAALLAIGCDSGEDRPADPSPSTSALADFSGGRVTVAAAGDFGMERAGIATLEAMHGSDADLFLGLGDFSYAGPGSEEESCELVNSKLGADAPFIMISPDLTIDGTHY